jgi:hypothetical protein
MRKIAISLVFIPAILVFWNQGFSQTSENSQGTQFVDVFSPGRFHLSFQKGGTEESEKIEGSQYIHDRWHLGKMSLTTGKTIDTLQFRYNAFKDKMEFVYHGDAYLLDKPERVKRIKLLDYNDNVVKQEFVYHPYINGNNKKKKGYFQLLVEGDYNLLVKYECRLMQPNYNLALDAGNKVPRLVHTRHYYLKEDGEPARKIKDKWKNFLAQFGNQREKIEKYSNYLDLNPKYEEDLIKIIRYANSLAT